jgi:ribosomal protein S18 acetylase RimI-like enzyme
MKSGLDIGFFDGLGKELKPAAIIAYAFADGQAMHLCGHCVAPFDNFTTPPMVYAGQNSFLIRAARADDAAALASLARQLLEYEKSLNEAMGELTVWAASADEVRKQIRRPGNQFFVAERAGGLVGYIKVVVHGQRLAFDELGVARWLMDRVEQAARGAVNRLLHRPRPNIEAVGGYIAGAFVHPGARRLKIGRMLVAAAEDWLRAQGITSAELHVLHINESAKLFWEEAGYEPLTLGMRKKLDR